MSTTTHKEFMSIALQLAQRGRFSTSPNPMVGCVIVKNQHIVGRGFHRAAGEAHAEINALKEAGLNASGATAYISLEPCCHYGRTPPCTEAIIQSGIKKIVVATLDPNPLVAGKGIEALRAAGIKIEIGLGEAEAKDLNEIYFHYIKYKRPYVIAKWAMSLDGKTMTNLPDSRQISCIKTNQVTHQLRAQVDAILIGSRTAIQDDPLLTVRFSNEPIIKYPKRIILASRGQLPPHLKLFETTLPAKTIVATTNEVNKNWYEIMIKKNIEIIVLPKNSQGQVDLPSLMDALAKKEIASVLVEGGRQIHENFFKENLINKVHVYLAPVIIGSLKNKRKLANISVAQIDDDFHFIANEEQKHV